MINKFKVIVPSLALVCALFSSAMQADPLNKKTTRVVFETQSKYSHIKITDRNGHRTLLFVRDNGDEVIESAVDINAPQSLVLDYTQLMFTSFLLNKRQKNCLLVGLGGGGMVNFINYYFPEINLDVVEIDPVIISIAKKYFKLNPNTRTKILNEDGFKFISADKKKYDVIYMDAFLKPSAQTDDTGVPKNLKTRNFYGSLKKRLAPDGMVVFNINHNENIDNDINEIKNSFSQVYIFRRFGSGNIIVLGSKVEKRSMKNEIIENGLRLDANAAYNFSFAEIASSLEE